MKYIIHVIHRCLELINRRVQPHTQTMQRRLHGSVYFQHNFGTFQFRRKWMHRSVFVRVHNTIMTKRKILQSPQILFSCPNFADCFVGLLVKIRGKIDLNVNCENVVTWAQGSGWFWVMHSCRSIKGFFFIVCLTLVIQLLIATFQNRTEQDYSWPVCVHRARAQCANTICQARMVRTLRVLSRVFEEQKLPPRPSPPPPPPKGKCPASPQKILLSLQYISCCIGKSSRRDEVSAHTGEFLKIVSQNSPDCNSAHIPFKIFPGACPRTPLGSSRPSATRDFSPKQ